LLFVVLITFSQKILLDDKGETYKDNKKDVHNLIRFVGKKIK